MSIARDIADDINVGNVGLPLKDSNNADVLAEDINGVVTLTADEANVGSNALVVNSSGKVGIGDSAPDTKLTIQVSSSTGTVADTPSIVLSNRNTTNATFVHSGIFADTYRDVANPHYSAGVWFTRIPYSGNASSTSDIIFGTQGNVLAGTLPAERMRIDSSGNLLVKKTTDDLTTPGFCTSTQSGIFNGVAMIKGGGNWGTNLFVGRTYQAGTGTLIEFWYDGATRGAITTNGTSTSYNTASDYRLKENITEITDGISRVKQLNPSRFNFISDPENTVDGFIAHEVQDIVTEAVSGQKDAVDSDGNPEYQGVDYGRITPLLTAALKEAIEKIEMLEARIAVLEAK